MTSWNEMIVLDPRLAALLDEVRAPKHRRNRNFCKEVFWGGVLKDSGAVGIKFLMCQCVGHSAAVKELRNSEAYDRAYRILYSQVPNCRHDGECTYDHPIVPGSRHRDYGSKIIFEPLITKLRRAGQVKR